MIKTDNASICWIGGSVLILVSFQIQNFPAYDMTLFNGKFKVTVHLKIPNFPLICSRPTIHPTKLFCCELLSFGDVSWQAQFQTNILGWAVQRLKRWHKNLGKWQLEDSQSQDQMLLPLCLQGSPDYGACLCRIVWMG